MRRPGAMRFHAALRASHSSSSVGDVQFIQVTHDESFALTLRKTIELLSNDIKDLRSLQQLRRLLAGVRDAWERGEAAPLSLAPLYLPASALEEAGGLLYHRPAHPQRPPGERGVPDFGWEFTALEVNDDSDYPVHVTVNRASDVGRREPRTIRAK